MEHVQVLPLVLMETLHLYVEQRIRIYHDADPILYDGCKSGFVATLDLLPFRPEPRIISKRFYLPDLFFEMFDPAVADRFCDQTCKFRVAQGYPASRGHPVRHVHEAFGI